jgi:MarR-like DNA-binding transcriptional regulator SgrR of sgrS sRNA
MHCVLVRTANGEVLLHVVSRVSASLLQARHFATSRNIIYAQFITPIYKTLANISSHVKRIPKASNHYSTEVIAYVHGIRGGKIRVVNEYR